MPRAKKRTAPKRPAADAGSLLRKAGYRATPGRIALIETLEKSPEPLSIKEIMRALGTSPDQVTVYRTLEALEQAGLVRRVDLRHGHADYEIASREDHHHLVCTRCGRVEDFSGCDLEPLVKKAIRKSGFASVSQHALELFGLCRPCAQATSA